MDETEPARQILAISPLHRDRTTGVATDVERRRQTRQTDRPVELRQTGPQQTPGQQQQQYQQSQHGD